MGFSYYHKNRKNTRKDLSEQCNPVMYTLMTCLETSAVDCAEIKSKNINDQASAAYTALKLWACNSDEPSCDKLF